MIKATAVVVLCGGLCLFGAGPCRGETIVLGGAMRAQVRVQVTQTFEAMSGTTALRVKIPRFSSVARRTTSQEASVQQVDVSQPVTSRSQEVDAAGNPFDELFWQRPAATVVITSRSTVASSVDLKGWESTAPYPVQSVPSDVRRFLDGTSHVQKDHPTISAAAADLTRGIASERLAVSRILNFVADRVTYKLEPERFDALSTLSSGVGNCTNFSHLSLALLRAAGIPARAVTGMTFAKTWAVPFGRQQLVEKSVDGRHAWIEVWYSDAGWVPYDPQSLQHFVSTYHVQQMTGRDVEELLHWYRYQGAKPVTRETISAEFLDDQVALEGRRTEAGARRYILAADVRDTRLAPSLPQFERPTPPPTATPAPPANPAELMEPAEFGNLDFPAALKIFHEVGGGEVRWALVAETAEYVTGQTEFAQAFRLEAPMRLADVALAMQKFGGTSGEIWLELRGDGSQAPGSLLGESRRVGVDGLVPFGGYRWLVFDFNRGSGGPVLPAGRYWVVLRYTGDPVFNWYFTPGTAFGEPDDSRARARGSASWDSILNYRFNFRVSGLVKP